MRVVKLNACFFEDDKIRIYGDDEMIRKCADSDIDAVM